MGRFCALGKLDIDRLEVTIFTGVIILISLYGNFDPCYRFRPPVNRDLLTAWAKKPCCPSAQAEVSQPSYTRTFTFSAWALLEKIFNQDLDQIIEEQKVLEAAEDERDQVGVPLTAVPTVKGVEAGNVMIQAPSIRETPGSAGLFRLLRICRSFWNITLKDDFAAEQANIFSLR